MLSFEDGEKFLDLARNSVKTYFLNKEPEDSQLKEMFSKKQGVFVTLHKNMQLRGCIGYPEPVLPLYDAVIKAARSAAFNDPRFPPVSEDEIEDIKFEVSVLTVPEKVNVDEPDEYLKKVRIGKDGLIIKGYSSGLLLPQVAEEWNFNQQQFLECVSEKAGMEKDAWKNHQNEIYTFQAQIFSETDAGEKEKPKNF